MRTDGNAWLETDLVLNHAANLRQEVLADDAVEMAVLRGGFVLDALRKADPLLLRIAHQGPGASLAVWQGGGGGGKDRRRHKVIHSQALGLRETTHRERNVKEVQMHAHVYLLKSHDEGKYRR